MSRWKAGGVHLAASLFIAILVGALIYFIWYPQPYFTIAGGSSLMMLIMGVDVVIGPLLTVVVFKTGKKSLGFDLAVVSLLQACAFCYGLFVISQARPVFVVARIDRFISVAAIDVDDADLAQAKFPEFSHRSWSGPRLVGASLPSDFKEREALMFSGSAGKDIERLPKYYQPYDQVANQLLTKAHPLAELRNKSAQNSVVVDRFLLERHASIDQFVFLPLQGKLFDYSMLISNQSAQPVAALPIDPW